MSTSSDRRAASGGATGLGDGPIIVTGGAGFVGANLVAELLAREPDRELIIVDDLRAASFLNVVEACQRRAGRPYPGRFEATATTDLPWRKLIKRWRPAAVFHLAAITDTTVMDERVMIGDNVGSGGDPRFANPAASFRAMLLAAAERDIPVVYASSAATYGTPPEARDRRPFAVSSAGAPNNVYGFSKWLMENEHRSVTREFTGLDPDVPDGWERSRVRRDADIDAPHIVGLRYFNVFGPGEARKGKMASLAWQLGQQMLDGKHPRLFEHGEQARDQVSVRDVVGCTIAAAMPGARPGVYNLGSGKATTFNDVAEAVRDGLGFSPDQRPIEYFPMPEHIRAFYQDFTQADMSNTASGLGWRPSHEPLDALREYGGWMREQRQTTSAATTPAGAAS